MRETSYGLVPDLGGTQPLVRAVGYARAVDICATGRTIDAEEGFRLGFVTRVVDDLEAAVADVVAAVASAVAVYGGIDLFVSNAGVLRAEGVMTQPVADFDLVTAVNYRGYFLCVRAVAPVMAAPPAPAPFPRRATFP